MATEPPTENRIVPISINEEMKQSYLLYSMSVIVSRALPDVRDGLKPVQRRILQAMHDLNLSPGAQTRKSAKVCGDTSGNYHPHGEAIVYPALVRLAQDFSLRYPLVLGQGNFGNVDGDPPAAMRYTEVKMSPIAMELLADIDKNTVDYVPNYDQRMQEPTVLPGRFPELLANGASGIAVGMATNIPPQNLSEICDAITHYIDNPGSTPTDLMQHLHGPDFPTAGLILGTKGIKQAYETGRGSVVMQAKTTIEPMDNGKSAIIVSEIPYQVNKTNLIKQIAALVKEKKVDGITDLNDYSDKHGMRIVIELRRDAHPQRVLNYLLKHTALRQTFGVLMLALVDGAPRVLNIAQMIGYYIKHRQEVIRRRTQFDLDKAEARAHIVEGLIRALDVIDEIIRIIRASRNPEVARTALMEAFQFSQIQAQHILEMQLQRLTGLERDKLEAEYRDLQETIARLKAILGDPQLVFQIIKDDLKDLKKKYGDARRTRIIPVEADQIGEEDTIPEEETIVSITRNGYIKRVSAETYRVQKRGGRGVIGVTSREEDEIEHLFVATTHHYILFFTDRGRVYRVKAYEVPQGSRQAMGTAVINLISIEPGERVTATVPVQSLDMEGYLVMGTQMGEVKRTSLADFKNLRQNGLRAFDIEDKDCLCWVHLTTGNDHVMMVTEQGQAMRFPETELRVASRASGGVRGITLEKGDRLVGMKIVRPDGDILVVGRNGYGKRTPLAEFTPHHRGGKGILCMRVTNKTGRIADFSIVDETDRLLISTTNGIVIRFDINSIRRIGRATEGVRLINLGEGDHVATVARVEQTKRRKESADEINRRTQMALGLSTEGAVGDGNGHADLDEDDEDLEDDTEETEGEE